MGIAHMLYKMRIPYQNSFKQIEEITKYMTLRSMQESIKIAKEKGSYEAFNYDIFVESNKRFFVNKKCRDIVIEDLLKDLKKYGSYNSCFTSIAPTGSISFLGNTSQGIEPVFRLAYSREIVKHRKKENEFVFITDKIFDQYLVDNFDEKTINIIKQKVVENDGSCQNIVEIPEEICKVFVVASDITPMEHLNILQASANNCSLSVSKCVSKNTLVKTKIGYKHIKDFSKNRKEDTFEDINEIIINKNGEEEQAIQFYYNGIKKCKKIILSNGIEFISTPQHKLFIKNEWIEVDNLKEGDFII